MDKVDNQLKYEKALEYEIFIKEEYGFAKKRIQQAKCVFDIWWHIWLFSKWCRKLNPNVKIYYFEPVGAFYDKSVLALWSDENIILNNCGISSETWTWNMLLNTERTMQSSKYSSFLNKNGKEIEVKFITLKEYIENNDIDRIDVLKMDIEWMEFEVLNSWSDFEWWKIDSLIVEVHLLNDEMKFQRNQIFQKIKNIFESVKIINSWYREEIFLLWANKKSWL